jgi:hypothetical protein
MEAVKKTLWTNLRWKVRFKINGYEGIKIADSGYPVLIKRKRVVGYTGGSESDAGYYYCPYVPLMRNGNPIISKDED